MRPIRAQSCTGWKRMAGFNWITAGDGSRPDMDHDRIWMDNRMWVTGDGSQEMDHGRRMTINLLPFHEDIEVIRSYTLLEITYFDFKLRTCNRAQICRYTMYRRHGSTEYDTEHYSEHYSKIPNYAAYARVAMLNTIPNQIPSHSYNSDTAQAVRD
jgi:hypothetical protein